MPRTTSHNKWLKFRIQVAMSLAENVFCALLHIYHNLFSLRS